MNASPVLRSYKPKVLQAQAQNSQDLLNQISYDIDELKSKVEEFLEQKLTEEQYVKNIQLIEEYTVYGKLVSKIVSFENPELGRKIGLTIDAYSQIAHTAAKLSAEKISAGLATANIALISLSFVSAFSEATRIAP